MTPADSTHDGPWRCVFCRMRTAERLARLPLCPICRDQVQDFMWVSMIQGSLYLSGVISGLFFLVEESLLLVVLVLIKHRLPRVFERFVEHAPPRHPG